jgi:PAS domain S-box-containing protein
METSHGTLPDDVSRLTAERDAALRRADELNAELKQLSQRFAILFDSIRDYGFILTDPEGTITGWNRGAEQIFGYTEPEILGKKSHRLFSEEDLRDGKPEEELETARREGRAADDRWHLRKDGSAFWASGYVRPIWTEDGQLLGYAKITRELTESKRYQEQLELANRRIIDVLESMTDSFTAMDRDFRMTYVNARAAQYMQKDPQDVIGRSHWELWPETVGTDIERKYRQVMDERVPTHFEYYVPDASGGPKCLEIHVHPSAEGIGVFFRDITARKRAVEAIRASEERFRSAFASAAIGMALTDLDGHILQVNQAYSQLTGYTLEELQSLTYKTLTHPDDLQANGRYLEKLLRGEAENVVFEKRYICKQSKVVWVRISASLRRDEQGKPVEILGLVEDITERKKAEEALAQLTRDLEARVHQRTAELEAANRALREEMDRRSHIELALVESRKTEAIGRLAGGVAHDFNNLITGIRGIVEDLREQISSGPQHEDLTEVLKACQKAQAVTTQLLAFGRRQVVAPRVINLNHLVTDSEEFFRRLLREDIELRTTLDPGLASVRADQAQMEQTLHNLILNARDALPHGGRIEIATKNVELDENYSARRPDVKPGPYVMLEVSDTGQGMNPSTLERIFEPFFTTKGLGKGSGLGLPTVYGIVKQAGGDIAVTTEEGKGSRFKIYLPRVEEMAQNERRSPTRGTGPSGSETVLVVEDEEIVRRVATNALRKRGYNVLEASNGAAALKLLDEWQGTVDLLLTDIVMPGMNGRDLAHQVTGRRPETAVLFMSGHPHDIIAKRGAIDPNIAFIEKSFSSEMLTRKVREVLDTARRAAGRRLN